MIQKTTTHTTTPPVEAFSLHLRSQGYALISLLVALSCATSTHALIKVSIPLRYITLVFQGTHGTHNGSQLYLEHFHSSSKASSIRRCRLAFLRMGR